MFRMCSLPMSSIIKIMFIKSFTQQMSQTRPLFVQLFQRTINFPQMLFNLPNQLSFMVIKMLFCRENMHFFLKFNSHQFQLFYGLSCLEIILNSLMKMMSGYLIYYLLFFRIFVTRLLQLLSHYFRHFFFYFFVCQVFISLF